MPVLLLHCGHFSFDVIMPIEQLIYETLPRASSALPAERLLMNLLEDKNW